MTAIQPFIDRQSLKLDDDLTQDEWIEIGRSLATMERGIQWVVGDWINHGIANYHEGTRLSADILAHHGPDALDLYADMAAVFEPDRRRPDLSFSHHVKVKTLMRALQDRVLDQAAEMELTVREVEQLRNEIRTDSDDAFNELTGGMTKAERKEAREEAKRLKVEHSAALYRIWRSTKESASDVRVPRDIFERTILPQFKEPKTVIDAAAK